MSATTELIIKFDQLTPEEIDPLAAPKGSRTINAQIGRIRNIGNFHAEASAALEHILSMFACFPRKHRLDPTDEGYPSDFSVGSFELLTLARESLLAAMEINQTATPHLEGHEFPRLLSEPLQQAALEAMARETRRQLESERASIERLGLGVRGTHQGTEPDEASSGTQSEESRPSDGCHPPSPKSEL